MRVPRKPGKQRTRSDAIMACWASTGRRATIYREEDFGDDLRTRSQIEIVDGRWVGAVIDYEGGVSESIRALVYDARNRRRVHESKACDFDRGDFSGVDDAAFLPKGGMAFACNRLFMFRTATSSTLQTLEPAGTDVLQLAVGRRLRGFSPRLYWTVLAGDTTTGKSIPLPS